MAINLKYSRPFMARLFSVPKIAGWIVLLLLGVVAKMTLVAIWEIIKSKGDDWLAQTTTVFVQDPHTRGRIDSLLVEASRHSTFWVLTIGIALVVLIALISAVQVWRVINHGSVAVVPMASSREDASPTTELPIEQKYGIELAVNEALKRRTITVGGESNSVTSTTTTSATVIDFGPHESRLDLRLRLTLAPSGGTIMVGMPHEIAPSQSPNIVFTSFRGAHIFEDMEGSTHWTISETSDDETFRALLAIFVNEGRTLDQPAVAIAKKVRASIHFVDAFGTTSEIDPATWIDSWTPGAFEVGQRRELILGYVGLIGFGNLEEECLMSIADRRQPRKYHKYLESGRLRGKVIATVKLTVDGVALKPEKFEITPPNSPRLPPQSLRIIEP